MLKDIDIRVHVFTRYSKESNKMYQHFELDTNNAFEINAIMIAGIYPISEMLERKIYEKSLSHNSNDYVLIERFETNKGYTLIFEGPDKYIEPEYFNLVDTISTIKSCQFCKFKINTFCRFYNTELKREKKRCFSFSQMLMIKT